MSLKLSDQLCFPIYAASRAMQQRYRPLLEPLGLTYPQYLVMLVLWEQDGLSVSALGARLHLDSGTLTPLTTRLEKAGLVSRDRDPHDRRVVHLTPTDAGRALRADAEDVPHQLAAGLSATASELDPVALKFLLDQLVRVLEVP